MRVSVREYAWFFLLAPDMQTLKKKYYVVMKNTYFKRGMRRGGGNPYPQGADSPLLPREGR
jgi:hypothetical protein